MFRTSLLFGIHLYGPNVYFLEGYRHTSTPCVLTAVGGVSEGLPSDMYNGIGLTTPRGSGTNGFVQRNFAAVRSRQERVDYKTDADIARLDKAMQRKPNKEILEHEWKRRIELECFQMQEDMEEQGWVHSNNSHPTIHILCVHVHPT